MVKAVLRAVLGSVLVLISSMTLLAAPAKAASLVQVTDFGPNPSNLEMHVYVPDTVTAKPAVVMFLHYCTGSGPTLFAGTELASYADRHGFVAIYPSATRTGNCFDSSSPESLRRGGGSDPVGLASMIDYAKRTYDADPNRIFAVGSSSGSMMVNVLLANYPDVFKAGASFMGVPFGCFASPWGWNVECATGQSIKTAQEWGDLVRASYPGYRGPRPRMQIWHGTEDGAVHHNNLQEQVKQWTDVHRLSQTPAYSDQPQPNWNRTRYGGSKANAKVEAISLQGVAHSLPHWGMMPSVLEFFGLSVPCRVTYRTNAWNTGLVADITVTNTGSFGINGWKLAFTLPNGQSIGNGWNADYTGTSGQVTAANKAYNGTIAPNTSRRIGFLATHTGDSGRPAGFTLNGTACVVD
ncbi:extracellular catalytic domain type 1 short-chain-length polyhydroxyalkanoate depolymerase [Rhizohabitans arisaemae]|uniref:extracellular catalytic domain type 1 short-chain-length polyhydroxyalkanoate depolymerase n=1 Tax=Rhizohabitans arisaemae TaxID=2720610 RepID=UPI0024B21931|nr:PHB depolymerase family esterase [Rhizohabitans arisaemae]